MRRALAVQHMLGRDNKQLPRVLQHESCAYAMVRNVLVLVFIAEYHWMNLTFQQITKFCR
ncbi:hypothetical protein D3C85_1131730 [compost metagenome]